MLQQISQLSACTKGTVVRVNHGIKTNRLPIIKLIVLVP
jgi:hypothetical protein